MGSIDWVTVRLFWLSELGGSLLLGLVDTKRSGISSSLSLSLLLPALLAGVRGESLELWMVISAILVILRLSLGFSLLGYAGKRALRAAS